VRRGGLARAGGPGSCGWVVCAAAVCGLACGIVGYDISQRALILDPVEQVVFDSDRGAVEVYAFKRTAISILYHVVGFDTSIVDVGQELDGDVLRATILCDDDDICSADWYAEVPLGTAIAVGMREGGLKLTGVDAEVKAEVVAGDVDGVALGSPKFALTVEAGAVTLAWAVAPTSVVVAVGAGDVALTVPAGSYRCALTARAGAAAVDGVVCDEAAAASLEITVQTGDIRVQGAA